MALILGTKVIEHDACFALFKDGKPVFVYEQERFNRVKHAFTYSVEALEIGLKEHGYTIDDIDYVTNYLDENLVKQRYDLYLNAYGQEFTQRAEENADSSYQKAIQYKKKLLSLGFPIEKIIDVRHHLGHCAAVFYPSPYKEAAILSIDGGGEIETCILAYAKDEKINILKSIPYPYSLGHLYETVTRWLGWGFGEEGKVMALASFGKPIYYTEFKEELIDIQNNGTFSYKVPFFGKEENIVFEGIVGKGRLREEEISQHHKDVASTIQYIVEEIMLKLSQTLKELTGSDTLLITGGVGLNSVANGKIAKSGIFTNVFAYPQANDAGLAIGGALFANYTMTDSKRVNHWVLEGADLGKDIDIENIAEVALKYKLEYEYYDDITKVTAGLIAENKIIAWVQGREEIGPRALGNRSIIANPLNKKMKDAINERVKFRENWRPFAPSVLEEDSSTFFELDMKMPYMLVVSEVKKEWREKLSSIMHIDFTARVQTVSKKQNILYHNLLQKVKEKIGIGMLLNTSYNVKGEPVVQNVEQAILDFIRTDIDILVIGNFLFRKGQNQEKIIKNFHPIEVNINKVLDINTEAILVYSMQTSEKGLAQYLLDILKENNLKHTCVDIYEDDLERFETSVLLIVLKINPFNLNHSTDKSLIKIIDTLNSIKIKTNKIIMFEYRGAIFKLEDILFLLN